MSAPSTEAIPVVDLCSISQSELCSLALSSSDAFDLRRCDDVVIPKIDRSVFNESAGSRKQTYSHLRLDPHKPLLPSASPSTSSAAPATAAAAEVGGADDDSGHRENLLIVSYLRQLLSREKYHPLSLSSQALAHPAPVTSSANGNSDNAGDFSGLLRKQGEKNVEGAPAVFLADIQDREVLNAKGQALDLVSLAEKADPFAEELRRRTAGLTTEGQLLGFMGGVEGQWGSRRRRRRIVDASGFGDHLPKGWKLLLGLRRKEGDISVYCRRYVSPSGKHFLSCKEVSSYVLSLIGHPNKMLHASAENHEDISNLDKTPVYIAGPSVGENNMKERHNSSTGVPISTSADQEKQVILHQADNQPVDELISSIACQSCNTNFSDNNAYAQHQLSCNLRSAKRRKLGKQIAEGVILKDGKFECQICRKTFEERHRYNGHIGVHVRYRGVTTEALSGEITSEQVCKPRPSPTVPNDFSNMAVPIEEVKLTLTEGAANSPQHKSEGNLCDIENSLDGTPKTTNSPAMGKVMDNQDNGFKGTYCRDQETVQSKNSVVKISNNTDTEDTKPLSDMDVNNNLTSHHLPSTVQGDCGENCLDGSSNIKVMAGDEFEEVVHSADIKDVAPNSDMVTHSGAPSHKSDDVFESTVVSAIKRVDAVCAPSIDDSNVSSLLQASEICQSPPASTFVNNKTANLEVTGFMSEAARENQIATCIEQNSCKNSISISLVNDNNDLKSYTQTDVSSQSSGNLIPTSLANDNIVVCENSNEINVPMDPSTVRNSISSFLDVNSASCDDSLGMNISIEPSAFKNFISTSLASVNAVHCENSPGINISSTMNPEIEEYDGRDIQVNSGSNLFSLPDNRSHFSLETYTNIFGSSLEEDVPVQMDASREADFISSQGFSDRDAVTQSCMLEELNANCISMPFVDAQMDDNGRNIQSTFDVDLKKTLFEELESSGNELDGCFRSTIVRGQHVDASDTIQQNSSNSLQADLSLMSSWSSSSIPMVNMIPEQQCEDGRSIANQKQNDICSFNQLRLGTAESSDFASLSNQGSISGSMPPMPYGYATQLTSGSCTGVDLGWGLSLPSLPNGGCQMTSICVWCNREFSHQNINIAGEPDSLGFICPTCKAKISGQFSM